MDDDGIEKGKQMFYSNTLNLIQVGGGTQVKQGDLGSKFSYKLANEKGQELDDFDKEVAHINLVLDDKIVFTTTATVDNSTVTFNIDKAIPAGLYFLEIKIRDYIFPSDRQTIIFVQSGAVAYDLKELVPDYDVNMTLKDILSDLSQKGIDISDLNRRIAEKANKDEVTNVMTPKGNIAYASLPMTGNSVGWYYYCPDGDGTHGAGNYVWNGTSWFFGGTGDEGYNLLKKDLVGLEDELTTSETQYDYGDITTTLENGKYFTFNHETAQSAEADVVSINNDTSKNMLYADVEEGDKYLIEFTSQNWRYGGYGYAFAHNGGAIWNNQYIVDYCYTEKVGDTSNIVTIPSGSTRIYVNREDKYGIPTIKKIIGTHKVYKSKSYTKEESDERYVKIAKRLEKPTVLFIFDNCVYGGNNSNFLESYGLKGTYSVNNKSGNLSSADKKSIKKFVKKGHDIALYSGTGNRPSTYNGENAEEEWYRYIKNAMDIFNSMGLYLPTQYACEQHRASRPIVNACKRLGFKYITCGYVLEKGESYDESGSQTTWISEDTNDIDYMPIRAWQVHSGRTLTDIKNKIDSVVKNKQILALFTHNILSTADSTNASEEQYEYILEYIKPMVESGEIDVLTMREFYNKYHEFEGKNLDYTRTMSAILDNTIV